MTNRLLRISLAAVLLATLAGCGNKGPLVHPQPPVDEMAMPATTMAPADAAMPVPASTATAAPADTLPMPASTAPPADGGG